MARNTNDCAHKSNEKVSVVNILALEALGKEEFSPDIHSTRKLADVLKAFGELLENSPLDSKHKLLVNKRACDVCR